MTVVTSRTASICTSMVFLMPVLTGGDADVDGTLIRSIGDDANKLHKLAFAEVHAWNPF
jgi:hypothetical protein